jgi:Ulp1 family protease
LELIQQALLKASKSVFTEDSSIVNAKAKYTLSKGAVERLFTPREKFTEEILSAYLKLINFRERVSRSGNVYILDSFFVTKLECIYHSFASEETINSKMERVLKQLE